MNDQKRMITLTRNIEYDELIELRRREKFYCPQCQEPLLMRIGQVVIPHFAHQKNSKCKGLFSEGETTTHLLGKQLLYEKFQKLNLNVQLEPYLKELAQRPDLLIEYNAMKYAVEFQCSTIPIPKMESRTEGYLKEDIIPIWILQTPKDKQPYRNGIQLLKISPFKQRFITYTQDDAHMMTFNPEAESFVYFSHLVPLGGYRFIGNVQHLSLDAQHFPFLTAKQLSESDFQIYWQLWKQERKLFLSRRLLLSKKGVQDPFLRACYFLRIQAEKLPLFIGIPVAKNIHFSVVDAEWQLLWLMFLVEKGEQFTFLSTRTIYEFSKRYPTLFLNHEAEQSVKNYNFILRNLGITCMQSKFNEKILLKLLYDQFLAKR
ncbi:competence protein CoiA [Rummeliibacillus sp. TYF005]|uniref:competence protein CoiA n=1 Tax=Rummeliibacillus sp. TYF005 TaxID=2058214 RepID=UPI00210F724C|nr:competence protein CoiA family protein [Rummeliibacillus sp. TYF005]